MFSWRGVGRRSTPCQWDVPPRPFGGRLAWRGVSPGYTPRPFRGLSRPGVRPKTTPRRFSRVFRHRVSLGGEQKRTAGIEVAVLVIGEIPDQVEDDEITAR